MKTRVRDFMAAELFKMCLDRLAQKRSLGCAL